MTSDICSHQIFCLVNVIIINITVLFFSNVFHHRCKLQSKTTHLHLVQALVQRGSLLQGLLQHLVFFHFKSTVLKTKGKCSTAYSIQKTGTSKCCLTIVLAWQEAVFSISNRCYTVHQKYRHFKKVICYGHDFANT